MQLWPTACYHQPAARQATGVCAVAAQASQACQTYQGNGACTHQQQWPVTSTAIAARWFACACMLCLHAVAVLLSANAGAFADMYALRAVSVVVNMQMAHLDAFFPAGPSSSAASARHAADMVAEFEQAQVGGCTVGSWGRICGAFRTANSIVAAAAAGVWLRPLRPVLSDHCGSARLATQQCLTKHVCLAAYS